MSDGLDTLSAAFAEYMTPDEDGTPLLKVKDLGHALEFAGIPPELAPKIQTSMEVHDDAITFEEFINVIIEATETNKDMDGSSNYDHVFQRLSNSSGEITHKSLSQAAKKVKMNLTEGDIKKMLAIASTREEFHELWQHFGAT